MEFVRNGLANCICVYFVFYFVFVFFVFFVHGQFIVGCGHGFVVAFPRPSTVFCLFCDFVFVIFALAFSAFDARGLVGCFSDLVWTVFLEWVVLIVVAFSCVPCTMNPLSNCE